MSCRLLAVVRRATIALVLVAFGLSWSPGPLAPARADHEPAARLQLIIKKLIIHDDSDWGEGEITFTTQFWSCPDGSTDINNCYPRTVLVNTGGIEVLADSGDTLSMDLVLSSATDTIANESISTGFGIPVYVGESY